MFGLLEGNRRLQIRPWPWLAHYFFGVVAPVTALDQFTVKVRLENSRWTAEQMIMLYLLLVAIAFVCGVLAFFLHPRSAGVARKTWIFPLCFFVLGVCWDLHAGFSWRHIVDGCIVFLPGGANTDEPADGYFLFTFPALAAVSYSLASVVSDGGIFKVHRTGSEPSS